MNTRWWQNKVAQPSEAHAERARLQQAQLTKPAGSLGQLEALAVQLAAMQASEQPRLERLTIAIFAADHGVVAEGVSAYPQAVTAQMLANFAQGGAAISVLAQDLHADMQLHALGLATPLGDLAGVRHWQIAPGTANLRRQQAMTPEQCIRAMAAGREVVLQAAGRGCELFIGGEMGIGNTTAACALACALLDQPAKALVGPGTGLNAKGVVHKAAVIDQALALHRPACNEPFDWLCHVGGLELAALVGAYISAAQLALPVLVDGYIASAAALCAARLNPSSRDWWLFSHQGAEPGHAALLAALQAEPLLHLGLRLGEGSGAALAVPLLRQTCLLHNRMASFASAGVARGLA
ncbi:nicotinate-nucleotide--dimethylbenzimidazole phosphoribosyltransferase [Halopseudomonas salegens]|uniref:Nicotinate-nucleotide--dimethylbenzimidazole phosphoribosyltransferase n=1 Tax=Halopseudomonas salegens TaxID=1434072 RepID=A0A1H2HQW1_9GAMM|nr:nicotinate-nucleotide--dimethylbenzimidazole phosphoribosyltransferase [Halopseudomonas salegens]SDU34272.1 nicotinate-nucleotide-dimethylbenzimidazole phosphoribosyltransferase [Halopseudomonas salegens]